MKNTASCNVCFRHCRIEEGSAGFCRARVNHGGIILPENAGKAVSLALDPMEKKPLRRFYPGSRILSYGSYGCNLRCPFCQNYEISQADEAAAVYRNISAEELVSLAVSLKSRGNIGIAFTYNEPMISWEYIRDAGRLAHSQNLKVVMVTNGTATVPVLENVLPYVDAMNIDLKSFSAAMYKNYLKGDLEEVKAFIARAVRSTHVELTTLIIPGRNDSEEEMDAMARWISSLPEVNPGQRSADRQHFRQERAGLQCSGPKNSESQCLSQRSTDKQHFSQKSADPQHPGENIPLHISRYFPRWKEKAGATDVETIYRLRDVAARHLRYVYTGNC